MTGVVIRESAVEAIVFDLDGVIVESEHLWDEVRRGLARDHGRAWPNDATRAMLGMSTPEWSAYLSDTVGIGSPPAQVAQEVLARMADKYAVELPLIPGAVETVRRLAEHWPLGLASSSSRSLIDIVLETADISGAFAATVSTEEVSAGKPSPVVYQTVVELLGVSPERAVAIEDSSDGLRSAKAAGLLLIALPSRDYPPVPEALALADAVAADIADVTPKLVTSLLK